MMQWIPKGNRRTMEQIADSVLQEIGAVHPLTECDTGRYRVIRIKGIMKFHVSRYLAEKLGNISVMKVHAGPMQMLSVMLTPTLKNAPLMSLDYIYIFSKRKVYIEFLDLNRGAADALPEQKKEFLSLASQFQKMPDLKYKHSWQDSLLAEALLKSGTASDDSAFFAMQKAAAEIFLAICDSAPELNPKQAGQRAADIKGYYKNLIGKGGLATDVFRKSRGEEWTESFFADVFFGI